MREAQRTLTWISRRNEVRVQPVLLVYLGDDRILGQITLFMGIGKMLFYEYAVGGDFRLCQSEVLVWGWEKTLHEYKVVQGLEGCGYSTMPSIPIIKKIMSGPGRSCGSGCICGMVSDTNAHKSLAQFLSGVCLEGGRCNLWEGPLSTFKYSKDGRMIVSGERIRLCQFVWRCDKFSVNNNTVTVGSQCRSRVTLRFSYLR